MKNCLDCDHHLSGQSKDCEKCISCGGSIKYNRSKSNRICEVEGCTNKHFGKGYCRKHYNEFVAAVVKKERRKVARDQRIKKLRRLCEIEFCYNEHYAKGMCKMHYYQKWRNENRKPRKAVKVKKHTVINKNIKIVDKKLKYGFSEYAIFESKLENRNIELIELCDAEKKFIGIDGDVVVGKIIKNAA